jgi:hypothetical protein
MKKFSPLFFLAGAVAASTCSLAVQPLQAQNASLRQLSLSHPTGARTLSLISRGGVATTARVSAQSLTTQAVGVGNLSFTTEGFTTQEARDINAFVQKVYGRMVQVYGQPAPSQRGRTVRIIRSSTQGGGQYDPRPGSAGFNTIQFYLYDKSFYIQEGYFTDESGVCNATCEANSQRVVRELNEYNLLRQMLLAFRGSQLTAFDAWDGGQADAAALVIASQLQGNGFDPSLYGLYALPYYDIINRPELGGKYFYTSTADAAKSNPKNPVPSSYYLALLRYGMAQAAWLKVWVENPNFFAQFNARYYSRTDNPGQNAATLSAIAGSVSPLVEGLSWNDWLRRQYILDTTVRVGAHAYSLTFPLYTSANDRSTFESRVFYFQTDATGNERPLTGTAVVDALDEKGNRITSLSPDLRVSNKVSLIGLDDFDFAGSGYVRSYFEPTGKPDIARITLRYQVGSKQSTSLYAHNVAGAESKPNGFFGVTTATDLARFALQANGLSTNGVVQRGAWSSASTYPSASRVKTTFSLSPSDGSRLQKFQRNTAWSFLQTGQNAGFPQSVRLVFETVPSNTSVTASWPISNSNKWRLISVPVTPAEADEARALQIPAATLTTTLARYVSAVRAATDLKRNFPFGVTSAKHTFYPGITSRAPLGPGRAYWLKLDRNKLVTIKGGEPDRAFAFDVPLSPGWNAVGVPFNAPFALGAVQVRVNGETLSWSEAVARGWVSPGVWRWKPEGGYARADLSGALSPFEGYFVFTNQSNAALTFDSAKRTGALIQPTEGAGAWRLGLNVSSGAGATSSSETQLSFGTTTFTGTQPARRAAARPPWGERSVALAFTSSGSAVQNATQAGSESGWAESFVPPLASSVARWDFVVDGSRAGDRVVLSWGDMSKMPANFQFFLVDEAAKVRQEMTQLASHAYAWTASGPKIMRIEAVPRRSSASS